MSDIELPDPNEIEPSERGVGIAISLIAVLLAITSALGNKADNDEIVGRVDESNTWSQYQAKKVRSTMLGIGTNLVDVVGLLQGKSAEAEAKVREVSSHYSDETKRYDTELAEIKQKAEEFRSDADKASRQGDMYDMAELLFQISLVLASITLLLKTRTYFRAGLGIAVCASTVLAYAFFLL